MKYQVAIIGGGPAGYTAAETAGKAGLSVVLFEKQNLGGVCLNEGCIPTKTLLYSAKTYDAARHASKYAVNISEVSFDLPKIIARKQKVVRKLVLGVKGKLTAHGVNIVQGEATIIDKNTVQCGGETYECENLILCTGSETFVPPIPGVDTVPFWTHRDALDNKELPASLAIIGGGVIGLEFASIFNSFGSKVTVIEYCKEILPNFDRDIAKRLRTSLKKQGIEFITGAPVTAIHVDSTKNNEIHVSYEYRNAVHDCLADKVLMAVGRGANLSSLNLDEAGIAYTKKGITVDEHMQTNVSGVYAVGDINGLCQLAHAATFQSYCALSHVLGNADFKVDLSIVPAAVFTTPEAAMVGLTEEEAKAQNIEVKVHKAFYRANGRALAMDAGGDGLVKIIAHDDIVVGAHILGAHSSELIHEIALLMSKQGTLADIRNCIHAHPTLSELVLQAAES